MSRWLSLLTFAAVGAAIFAYLGSFFVVAPAAAAVGPSVVSVAAVAAPAAASFLASLPIAVVIAAKLLVPWFMAQTGTVVVGVGTTQATGILGVVLGKVQFSRFCRCLLKQDHTHVTSRTHAATLQGVASVTLWPFAAVSSACCSLAAGAYYYLF